MIVKIVDYGDDGNRKFVEYDVIGLSQNQIEFLDDNLDEKTTVEGDVLKVRGYFDEEIYPFQSETAKIRLDDFIAREEIEMNIFISSFLEDM